MPLRETAPKLIPGKVRAEFCGHHSADESAAGGHRGRAMPVLLRCAVHPGVPHAHRCSGFHQTHHDGKYARRGACDSRSEYPGRKLRPGLPHRSAVRRRVRDASRKARKPSRSAGCNDTPWIMCWTAIFRLVSAGDAEWTARGLYRFRPGIDGVRGPSCAAGLRRHDFRSRANFPVDSAPTASRHTKRAMYDSLREVEMVKSLGVEFRQKTWKSDGT